MKKLVLFLALPLVLIGCTATETPTTDQVEVEEKASSESEVSVSVTMLYSLEDVAKHSTPEDCWLVIDGKVYDVSDYGSKHPGGEAVYEGCGIDATELFNTRPTGSGTPHSDKARSFLPNFYIGDLG